MAAGQPSRSTPPPSVPGWLADPALGPLWEAARARLERSHLTPTGRIVLSGLQRAERHAIGDLIARPIVTDRVAIDLAELDRMLSLRSPFRGLATVVATVTGRPLRDRRAERSAAVQVREEPLVLARQLLAAERALADIGWAEAWLAAIRRSGLLTRSADPARTVRHAVTVIAAIWPAGRASTSRTELAAQVSGNAHTLDDGTVVAQAVLRALALDLGVEPPATAAARRDLWERYGVSADTVSSTCLTLGLLIQGTGPVADRLRLAAEAGDPVHVTPRDLRRLELAPHQRVLVCENPRVLEAVADRFGGRVPVICTAGQPKLVGLDLLRRLARAQAVLHYHGDFDWPGIAIANRLHEEVGVTPWLMSASDYQEAARRHSALLELTGTPACAAWDPMLHTVMSRCGVAVHEEAVLEDVLACLISLVG